MRFYIGNRVHLAAFITGLYDYDNTTRKFADVLSGKKTRVTLGYPEIAAAKSFGVSPRTKIVLKRSYALHMDNSGHFTGLGYGKNGHRDPYPLTIRQVSLIPEIIKTAKQTEIFTDERVRGLQRYRIERKESWGQIIIVEVSINRNEIYLVTAYNKNNTPTIGCIY